MAKTLEQRIAQLEKLITDFFTGGSPTKRPRKQARRKAKKAKTAKRAKRKSPRQYSTRRSSAHKSSRK